MQNLVLTKIPKSNGGAFGNLGGDVDNMIQHGQEAWNAVRRLLNVEEKAFFTANAARTPTYTWSVTDLTSGIAQGVTDSERTGDSIKLMELNIRGYLEGNSNTNYIGGVNFRIVVTRSVDEALDVADVFVDSGSVLAPVSQFVWDTRKQYVVIHDELYTTQATAYDATNLFGRGVNFHLHRKLNSHSQFLSNSTTVEKGAIQVWMAVNVASGVTLQWSAKLVYVDN
jgi:hypothetical protein